MSDTARIKTPSWDGTAEKAPMYIIKFKAKSGGGKETGNVEVCVAAVENSDFQQARC